MRAQEKSNLRFQMRYFIFYPPTKSIRLIDVPENVRVEDILKLVKTEFGLQNEKNTRSETSIVLSYNGFDLKPKWSLTDLGIPSGAIIRCVYKEQKAADLYIQCGFNKQLLKLFDSSITFESTIGSIRKIISDKLGLPLSVFCLESFDGKQQYYDQLKLINYDIKLHDHIYLKVWKGYEKFLCSCIRGYSEHYAHDDLTRHYQLQVALYIAAFYGHIELANSAMQHGARSDHPVGEHPSRQWSFETTMSNLPESLQCPIHIAIQRGHVKMVDLFVRHSVLCTQVSDPITGHLPFRLALLCTINAKTKEEKRCFNEIFFYLHDKQYNLKIPINANGEYVTSILTSTTGNNAVHRTSTHHVNVSLPFYCRIISWYERARENVWKKFGGHVYASSNKRIYPSKGLLGYKVLIDGYNNTFEATWEGLVTGEKIDRYVGYTNEEREKIIRTKAFIKQVALDERQRAKQIATSNLQARRERISTSQTSTDGSKQSIVAGYSVEGVSYTPSDLSCSQIISSASAIDLKGFKPIVGTDNLTDEHLVSMEVINPIQNEINHTIVSNKNKQKSKILQTIPAITILNDYGTHLPPTNNPSRQSISTNRSETVANPTKKNLFQSVMSSADAYLVSSTHLARENKQNYSTKKRQFYAEIEQSLQEQDNKLPEITTTQSNRLLPIDRDAILDVDSYIPLPDHSNYLRKGPIKSRHDLDIRQSTFQAYERYASASIRSTAVNCLEEASFFKRKSWLKQVEMSKEMIKHRVQRRIHQIETKTTNNKPSLIPIRATHTTTIYKSTPEKVN